MSDAKELQIELKEDVANALQKGEYAAPRVLITGSCRPSITCWTTGQQASTEPGPAVTSGT